MIPLKKCDGCSKELPIGSTKYNVRIEVQSDYDGFLTEYDEDADVSSLDALLDEIEQMSAEDLEEDVHLEVQFTLCPECRNRFVEQVESSIEGGIISKPKSRPSFH